ncbi:MAG: DUF3332 domain-containing protein [Prevotella sp.]|nr:DUF3332 domain-containing protein [Prevotella sp.]MBQ4296034.1 DUF3332 domain-containing protein [Prevotella sp.]
MMKKIQLQVAAILLSGCFLTSSCIGSFSLFNQYAEWQRDMSSNKYVNAIVGFFLMPIVGSVTLFIDAVILNTVEFWTGDNPVASNVGKTQQVMGQDGRLYAVKTMRNGYKITAPDGVVTRLVYDKNNDSWSVSQNGVKQELFRFNEDGKSIKVTVNGESRDFSLNEQGVSQARLAAMEGWSLATR